MISVLQSAFKIKRNESVQTFSFRYFFGENMKYTNENEIEKLVESFENATISREDWGHVEHLVVGFYYVWNNDFNTALSKMRLGIFNLLNAFGIDTSKESPYHETLTHFWIKLLGENKDHTKSLIENCVEIIRKFDKNYPLKYYSREFLFSAEARSRFVEPDLLKTTYFFANSK